MMGHPAVRPHGLKAVVLPHGLKACATRNRLRSFFQDNHNLKNDRDIVVASYG
jgi:hypothetical protein